jgi:predicted Rossmann fold flavoprotein
MLWTHFGISGPVVMDASRHWVVASESGQKPEIRCNFTPGQPFESVDRSLIDLGTTRPRTALINALSSRLPERMLAALLAHIQIDPALSCAHLTKETRRALVHALTALPLQVVQHRGWNYAEVTAGGVPLSEIDYRTMESRKTPNLHLAGEILDCDGRIGGFNFQWAWATGYLAGRAAVR